MVVDLVVAVVVLVVLLVVGDGVAVVPVVILAVVVDDVPSDEVVDIIGVELMIETELPSIPGVVNGNVVLFKIV